MAKENSVLVALGNRVRGLRKAAGQSQEEFAGKCGLDRTYIGGIERGERNVSLRNIAVLAQALGVEISVLLSSAVDVAAKTSNPSILETFDVSLEFLTDVVRQNPSLRGMLLGYLAERKLRDVMTGDSRVTATRKDDDHDREKKGDLVVTYCGLEFKIESKALQTNHIEMFVPATSVREAHFVRKIVRIDKRYVENEPYRAIWKERGLDATYRGKVQCDASDRRPVPLSGNKFVETTCLFVGEFEILAACLFGFREKWDFIFALNRDLPTSTSNKYPPDVQKRLLATLIPVTWPPQPPFVSDPFLLLDRLIAERPPKKP